MKSLYLFQKASYFELFVDDTIRHNRLLYNPDKDFFDEREEYLGVCLELNTKYNKVVHLAIGNVMYYTRFKETL